MITIDESNELNKYIVSYIHTSIDDEIENEVNIYASSVKEAEEEFFRNRRRFDLARGTGYTILSIELDYDN